MPRGSGWLTPLLVVTVLAVAAVAALDAVRRSGPSTPPATTAEGGPDPALGERLLRQGVFGALHYTDAACLRRSLSLPALELSPAQRVACEDELLQRRRSPAVGAVFPDGRPRAGCRRGVVERVAQRRILRRLQGCARAALPDGSLLISAGGAVVAARPGCSGEAAECRRFLLRRRDLRRAARRHPDVPSAVVPEVGLRDVAWLGGERYAVLLEARARRRPAGVAPNAVVALFERRRLVAAHPLIGPRPDGLAVSTRGSFVATTGELVLLRSDGSSVPLARPFAAGHAVAWSPDERWTAVATQASVLVVSTPELIAHARTGAAPSLVRLPLAARELAWDAG